ncbi:calmodulin-binding protein 60 A-like [Benincasa hispida]|uniref:calmodulin-binding protein 60 A-like n=1 Tax=Benincasa hispida TaxID=102211 RepID=UPI0018FF3090|nr:calmodulin-binding protein 60 A-like [Benincasa hispida]
MYDNEEIKSENGEALELGICDITNGYTIIYTGSLSSAPVDFFILDGQINSSKRRTPCTSSDFIESILTSREDKPSSLISVKNNQFYLKNGVCSVKNLVVTDNSCWTKSKTFCLGAKITDENVLREFGMIGEAVSEPFKVYDKRGKGTRKCHRPSEKDEVWRLNGIKKQGSIHNKLSSFKEISKDGIQNVGEFREALHQKGHTALKMYLGMTNSEKLWNRIESHLMEGVVDVPTNYDPTFQANYHFMETGQGNSNQNVEFIQENQDFQTGELGPNSNVIDELPEDLLSAIDFDIPPSPLGHMKLGA